MRLRCQSLMFFVIALAAAGCGNSTPEAPRATTPAGGGAAATSPTTHDGRVIEIGANDQMKFDVLEIKAKAGERLSVTLVNRGTMPKFSMGHNWVLLALGVDLDAFVAAATEAPANDYIPAAKSVEILASTKLLGPNERDTTTFNAPAKPGQYPFLCSFPGHYQIGMKGVLIVE